MKWWENKWREDRNNWEDIAARESNPEEVLAGIRNRARSNGRAQELLDDPSQPGRTVRLQGTNIVGADQFTTVLNLNAADQRARIVTIHCLATEELGSSGSPEPFKRVRGKLEWGQGGAQAEAEFDWLQGTTLCVAASFTRVSARLLEQDNEARVGAFAGYGSPGGLMRARTPQLTEARELAASELSALIPIPFFAQNVLVTRSDDVEATAQQLPFSIITYDFSGSAVNAAESYGLNEQMNRPMEFQNSDRFIKIRNDSDAQAGSFFAIFGLAL